MILLAAWIVGATVRGGLSAPISNSSSSDQFPSWRSEPNGRGTWSILSSCLITLVLCVWTAIHLNVPAQNSTRTRPALQRLKWVLMGLLAPELVVYTAWDQWISAKRLTKEMQLLRRKVLLFFRFT